MAFSKNHLLIGGVVASSAVIVLGYLWCSRRRRITIDTSVLSAEFVMPTHEAGPPDPKLLEFIRSQVIGADLTFVGPFGPRRMIYADYTASGRALRYIEAYINDSVLPIYANTHSSLTYVASQVNKLVSDARSIVRASLNCGPHDILTFTGAGSTSAVQKLVMVLQLHRGPLRALPPCCQRPVIFVSTLEHHSNILPWRESIGEVVQVPLSEVTGLVDIGILVSLLEQYKSRPRKIGAFSAGSNVTGLRSNVEAITRVLHAHGALSFWDFAGAGPYVHIDMNPADDAAIDALVMSPHKFIGGPSSPGVLVVKRHLYVGLVSCSPGGGTVEWVSARGHKYLDDLEAREEGGTPDIVGIIRCGLAFALKEQVGPARIEHIEHGIVRRVFARLGANPNIVILGSQSAPRVSIFSLLIRTPTEGRFLHHAFVTSLLNDLFGIQTRSGCSCAGPYGEVLLGILPSYERTFLAAEEDLRSIFKVGWARLNFNYFIDDAEIEFLLAALEFVAAHGYKFLPLYDFDMAEAKFVCRPDVPGLGPIARTVLYDLRDVVAGDNAPRTGLTDAGPAPGPAEVLAEADRLRLLLEASPPMPPPTPTWTPTLESIRYFLTPVEAYDLMCGRPVAPCVPTVYPRRW